MEKWACSCASWPRETWHPEFSTYLKEIETESHMGNFNLNLPGLESDPESVSILTWEAGLAPNTIHIYNLEWLLSFHLMVMYCRVTINCLSSKIIPTVTSVQLKRSPSLIPRLPANFSFFFFPEYYCLTLDYVHLGIKQRKKHQELTEITLLFRTVLIRTCHKSAVVLVTLSDMP